MLDILNTSSWTFFLVEIGFSFFGPQKQRKIMSRSPRTAFFKKKNMFLSPRCRYRGSDRDRDDGGNDVGGDGDDDHHHQDHQDHRHHHHHFIIVNQMDHQAAPSETDA